MSLEPRPVSPAMVAAALLRTGAWLYAALWVVVTAAAPWGPPGLLPVVCLAPLGPLVFLAVMRSMQRPSGRVTRSTPEPDATPARAADVFLSTPWAGRAR